MKDERISPIEWLALACSILFGITFWGIVWLALESIHP